MRVPHLSRLLAIATVATACATPTEISLAGAMSVTLTAESYGAGDTVRAVLRNVGTGDLSVTPCEATLRTHDGSGWTQLPASGATCDDPAIELAPGDFVEALLGDGPLPKTLAVGTIVRFCFTVTVDDGGLDPLEVVRHSPPLLVAYR